MNEINWCAFDMKNAYLLPDNDPAITIEMGLSCKGGLRDKIAELVEPMRTANRFDADWKKMVQRVLAALAEDNAPKAERVIVNGRATILFWDDGVKTVVKCRECGDGQCVFDKDFDLLVNERGKVETTLGHLEETVVKIARCQFCQTHFDSEKAVMAAMLKRLYPNFQDVLRDALEGDDE